MSLIVNRRDIDFLLFECLGADTLFATGRYSALDRDMVESILDTAQAIAEEQYLPFAASLDANEPRFVDGKVEIMPEVGTALRAYAEAGFFAAGADQEVGGLQLPHVVTMAINGMFTAANLGVANYSFLTIANANLLAAFGNEEQRRRFLPPMLEGRWFGTMCLSEPQAGSSLSDVRTRAEPLGDGRYSISGNKMWISGGDHEIAENIVHLVLARLPDAPPGVKGISLFIVPKYRVGDDGVPGERNGIALAGLNHKMGHRGTTNCLLNFGEDGPSIGHLVGEANKGLSYMFHMMNEARIGVGHASVMSALAGYLYALDYARTRAQGRLPQAKSPSDPQVPIIEHADVKRMLMAQKAAVEGALALTAYCALLVDRQKASADAAEVAELELLLDLLTPIAKSWPSEHCLEANKWAIQVLGGYGYTRDYPVERHYRDNRLNHIHEGTFGIQAIDLLGRKVRMDDGRALHLLLGRMTDTIAEAPAALAEEAAALQAAMAALAATTETVVASGDLNCGLANATTYLDAFGHVVIAWLWLRQAMTASAALGEARGDAAFYEGKVAACRYFFRYELPHVHPRFTLVRALDTTCLNLRAEHFTGA
ncbi:acyl-CoA dehydrogenase [Sphingopyxis indica]|uniref:acyl-CoA dehydrogenase n=1 Tax=Sphingopyxis indica TaxID=436663 RepID=UPI0029394FC1|nr:acyl-CoA dehydrogenase [Sphingopyxis indica]WOF42531.1 acyl-CoA dehydrogenase [Sphingopyxis indica]